MSLMSSTCKSRNIYSTDHQYNWDIAVVMLLWLIWRSPNFFDHLEKVWEEFDCVYLFTGCREKGHSVASGISMSSWYLVIVVLRCSRLIQFDQNKNRLDPCSFLEENCSEHETTLLLILATKHTSNLATIAWFVVTSWYYRFRSQTKPASSKK